MMLGLSGLARSGKDTVGSVLVKEYGFHRCAFADRMKELALALDPIMDWYVTPPNGGRPVRLSEMVDAVGWDRAKQNAEVRRLLQRIGTEAGRNLLGPNIWVNLTFDALPFVENVVVTDVRFPDEAERIVSEDGEGQIIRITRPGICAPNDHVSESAIDDWPFDYELLNDSSIAILNERVHEMMADLGIERSR